MPWRRRVHLGTDLDTSEKLIFTFNTNLVEGGALLKKFVIANSSGSNIAFSVWFYASGSGPSTSSLLWFGAITAGSTFAMDGPWAMDGGSAIKCQSLTASPSSNIRLTVAEEYLP